MNEHNSFVNSNSATITRKQKTAHIKLLKIQAPLEDQVKTGFHLKTKLWGKCSDKHRKRGQKFVYQIT